MSNAAKGVDKLSRRLKKVAGILSLHASYAEPVVTVVALAGNPQAEKMAIDVETEVLGETGEYPVDFLVYRVDTSDVARFQDSLGNSFGLLWKRN